MMGHVIWGLCPSDPAGHSPQSIFKAKKPGGGDYV